jgi:hypothetical protein
MLFFIQLLYLLIITTIYLVCAFCAQFVTGIRAVNLERKKLELNSIIIIYTYSAEQDRTLSGVLDGWKWCNTLF